MSEKFNGLKVLLTVTGAFVGLAIPVIFALLDLTELKHAWTLENIYNIFLGQNLYLFSMLLFPSIFIFISVRSLEKGHVQRKFLIVTFLAAIFGLLLGFSIPVTFAFLDLAELDLPRTYENIHNVFFSQNIYTISIFLFPSTFFVIALLFANIYKKNQVLDNQRSYVLSILNSMQDAIVVVDANGTIHNRNDAFNLKFGGQFINISDLYKENYVDQFNQVSEFKFSTLEGKDITYLVSHGALITNVGQIGGIDSRYILSFRDIQKLKEVEKTLELQKAQISEASKMASLGEMAAGFAHEINNPLAIIMGNLVMSEKMLNSSKELDKVKMLTYLEKGKGAVNRITGIIRALRNMARRGTEEIIEEFTLKEFIDDALNLCHLKLFGKNIQFTNELGSEKDSLFRGQRVLLGQVIMNLLNNAADAIENHPHPWIKVEAKSYGKYTEIRVIDSGNGIPENLHKKIFEPMYTTKDVGKGTGLGLSISKSIVETHLGQLFIDSSCPNTCFVVRIPKLELRNAS